MSISFTDILTGSGLGLASVAIAIAVDQNYTSRLIDNRRHHIGDIKTFLTDVHNDIAKFKQRSASLPASSSITTVINDGIVRLNDDIQKVAKALEENIGLDIRQSSCVSTDLIFSPYGFVLKGPLVSPGRFLANIIRGYVVLLAFTYFIPFIFSFLSAVRHGVSANRPEIFEPNGKLTEFCGRWDSCNDASVYSVSLFFLLMIFFLQAIFTSRMIKNFEDIDAEMTERFRSFRYNQESLIGQIDFIQKLLPNQQVVSGQ